MWQSVIGIAPEAALAGAAALLVWPVHTAAQRRLRSLRPGPARAGSAKRGRTRDDPLAAASAFDLLAACLRAGLPMSAAARASAPSAPEVLGAALARAADLLVLGADPASAWERRAIRASDSTSSAPGSPAASAAARSQ
ncbi:type II secretion system F family protein, partial [Nocardia thailandica]